MLDIIVTHYKEPWEIGKKFFDMLGCQQAIDFRQIHVHLIHDGTECFPYEYFSLYPYKVRQHRIEHGGVSAARNYGIEISKSKWIAFCDFDDMFSNCFALKTVLDLMDTDDFDMLWMDFWGMDRKKDGSWKVIQKGENVVFIHGRFFLRDYLIQSGIRFNTGMEFNEDRLFVSTLTEMIPKERIGHINTNFPGYVWCFTPNSATSTMENWWRGAIGGYQGNKQVVEMFKKIRPERYQIMLARMVWDTYYSMNMEEIPEGLASYLEDFRQFYRENKIDFWTTDPEQMNAAREAAWKQCSIMEQEAVERWGVLPCHRREGVNIKTWLDGLETGVF